MAETKKTNKKALLAVGILVVVLAAMAAVFLFSVPSRQKVASLSPSR